MGFEFISWTVWSVCQGAVPRVLSCFQNRRISTRGAAAGEHRGGSERVQYWWRRSQRPWTRLRTHCNERLQVKLCGQGSILYDTHMAPDATAKKKYVMWRWERGRREVVHTRPQSWRPLWQAWGNAAVDRGTGHAQRGWQDFSNCKFLIFVLLFPVEGLQRWRADMERLGNEWNQGTWYEIPKESIKLY